VAACEQAAKLATDDCRPQLKFPFQIDAIFRKNSNSGNFLRIPEKHAIRLLLPGFWCCRAFRTSGITKESAQGGSIEIAWGGAAHEHLTTTKLV
jgi:hypothetical protein